MPSYSIFPILARKGLVPSPLPCRLARRSRTRRSLPRTQRNTFLANGKSGLRKKQRLDRSGECCGLCDVTDLSSGSFVTDEFAKTVDNLFVHDKYELLGAAFQATVQPRSQDVATLVSNDVTAAVRVSKELR